MTRGMVQAAGKGDFDRRHPAYAVVSDSDDALWAAVRRLPARQAQAVALRYVADLDTTAIAATLGCSEGNVRVLLHRARQALAVALDRQEEDER